MRTARFTGLKKIEIADLPAKLSGPDDGLGGPARWRLRLGRALLL